MTGTEMTHIPFKGGAFPNTELLAGRLDVIFTTTTSAMPHVEAKRMRALAVTSLQPWPQLPQLPTVSQTVPGYEVMSFNGIGAPRATPRAIVMRINRELHAVLAEPTSVNGSSNRAMKSVRAAPRNSRRKSPAT